MNGQYILNNEIIGKIEDFKPEEWFGKVILNSMPEMAEYGTLDPNTEVLGDDGVFYHPPKHIQ